MRDNWVARLNRIGPGPVGMWHKEIARWRNRRSGPIWTMTLCGTISNEIGLAAADPIGKRCPKCSKRSTQHSMAGSWEAVKALSLDNARLSMAIGRVADMEPVQPGTDWCLFCGVRQMIIGLHDGDCPWLEFQGVS